MKLTEQEATLFYKLSWKIEFDGLDKIARKLRSGKDQPPLYSPIFQ